MPLSPAWISFSVRQIYDEFNDTLDEPNPRAQTLQFALAATSRPRALVARSPSRPFPSRF